MSAVGKRTVRTNSRPDSQYCITLEPIKFADLWASYPEAPPYTDPKTGKPPAGYENQCAIKVSVALHGVGVEMKSFNGKGTIVLNGKKTAILAQELADWLRKKPFCGCPQPEDITGENYESKIKGQNGIIFYKDYWARTGESRPTGDHIDLWNGSRLTASGFWGSVATFSRFTLGIQNGPRFSDLRKSTQILFWHISS